MTRSGADTRVDRNLRYLKQRFPDAESWQLSATGTKDTCAPPRASAWRLPHVC